MTLRQLRLIGPVGLLVFAVLMTAFGLVLGSGAAERLVSDPGAFVRWGLPFAKLIVNLAGGVMAGSLILRAFALPRGSKAYEASQVIAAAAAVVLTAAATGAGFLTYLSTLAPELSLDIGFGEQLGRFLTETELGLAWLLTVIGAAIISTFAVVARGAIAETVLMILAVVCLVPLSTQGHAGSLANHDAAVMALILHVVGAAVWVGGLLTLILVRPLIPRESIGAVVARYSSLALASFMLVLLSGVARALTSITALADLWSPYGALLGIKTAALAGLAVLGAYYRSRMITRLARRTAFWMLVAFELLIMGVAMGTATALSRTPAPADSSAPVLVTPAEFLTDAPLPAPIDGSTWLGEWKLDLLWAVLAGAAAVYYALGVHRIRRAGTRWSRRRTTAWMAGLALLAWVTSGPSAVYSDYMHSMNALGRVLLLTAVPLLLASAAPYELAIRTILPRSDGSFGPREAIMRLGASRVRTALSAPIVAALVFAAIVWVGAAPGIFRWTLSNQLGHQMMIVVSLVGGALIMAALNASGSGREQAGQRVAAIGIALVALLSFAAWVRFQQGLIAAEWFGAMGRAWGPEPVADQDIAAVAFLLGGGVILVAPVMLRASRSPARGAQEQIDTRKAVLEGKR